MPEPARNWRTAVAACLAITLVAAAVPIDLLPVTVAALLGMAAIFERRVWWTSAHAVGGIVLLAFTMRAGIALLIRGFGLIPPNWTSDALGFEFDAIARAESWISGGVLPVQTLARNRADSVFYRDYLALFASLGLWPIGWTWLANLLISSGAVAFTASAILRFSGWTWGGLLLAAAATLAPTSLVFGAMPVRDNGIFLAAGIVLWALASPERSAPVRIGALAGAIILALMFRVQYGATLLVGVGGTYFVRLLWRELALRMRPWVAVVVTLLIGVVIVGGSIGIAFVAVRAWLPFGGQFSLAPEFFALLRKSQAGTLLGGAGSGSSFLTEIAPHTWSAVFGYGVLTGILFLAGPPLGVGAGAGGIIVGWEGLVWSILLLGALATLRRERASWATAMPLALVVLMGIPMFGLTTVDYGSAARLRLQFIPFIVSLAALALRTPALRSGRLGAMLQRPLPG